MIKGLAHACYVVKDLAAAERFYCGALGLKPAFEFKDETRGKFGVYLKVGPRAFIELFIGETEPAPKASYRHICLEVDDLTAEVARLRKAGLTVTDPKLGKDQSWQSWISDPDGNAIELHQYTAASWQTPHIS